MSYERCERAAIGLAEEYADLPSEDWNESDTRTRVVNRLIKECLDWPIQHIHTEQRHNKTYTDYELGSDATRVVVEAKRVGTWFQVPAGSTMRVRSLASLTRNNAVLAEAVDQVLGYCLERGVPIGVLCNGNQILAFLGSRVDGVPPREGNVLVYGSLQEVAEDFQPLWDSLCPSGVSSSTLQRVLASNNPALPPGKLSDLIAHYPCFQRRNELQTNLQLLGEVFFEDLDKVAGISQEALRECYCSSGALSQYATISRNILLSRYSSHLEDSIGSSLEAATDADGLTSDFQASVLSTALMSRPICLVGDVGVGKTTFIKHLIEVDAEEQLADAIVIYIDLGVSPTLVGDLESSIQDQIERQLIDKYDIDIRQDEIVRGVHHGELQRFRRGVHRRLLESDPDRFAEKEIELLESLVADRASHIETCLRHFDRGQGKQVVIFLDNVDQRDTPFQERVFLIAQSIAETWPATVFVSLRPDTLISSRRRGSLDAYQLRVFTISPPRIDEVISRRISFANRKLDEYGTLPVGSGYISVSSDSLVAMLQVIEMSLGRTDSIGKMIDALSAGNVRAALDFLVTFLGSGNVNTAKILGAYERTGKYYVPIHEFLRAIMLGDYRYYDPTGSPVVNVLDIGTTDPKEHFLLPALIAFVDRAGRAGAGEGFVEVVDAYEHLQAAGFNASRVDWALERALRHDLLESDLARSESTGFHYLRITSAGSYTISELLCTFPYVDNILVDLPITDTRVRDAIALEDEIFARLKRAELLLDYLDRAWGPLGQSGLAFEWSHVSRRLHGEIARAREGASRRRGAV